MTGATGGLGDAIARAFAARGADLILTGRNTEVLEPLAAEVGGQALACDLSDRAQVAELGASAAESGVDVLVANAAALAMGLMTELSQEDIDRMLEVNLRAPIALAHALAPSMIARGSGHMVFISSLSGKAAQASSSIYSATKFALRGFALRLARGPALAARRSASRRSCRASSAAPGCSSSRARRSCRWESAHARPSRWRMR